MNVFIFVLLSVLLALIYILCQQIKQQRKFFPDIDKSLDQQLVSMLGGDKKVALRLLRHARKNHRE